MLFHVWHCVKSCMQRTSDEEKSTNGCCMTLTQFTDMMCVGRKIGEKPLNWPSFIQTNSKTPLILFDCGLIVGGKSLSCSNYPLLAVTLNRKYIHILFGFASDHLRSTLKWDCFIRSKNFLERTSLRKVNLFMDSPQTVITEAHDKKLLIVQNGIEGAWLTFHRGLETNVRISFRCLWPFLWLNQNLK